MRGSRNRRGGLLAPAPTGVFLASRFLCHPLAHFEPGDSHRQHHGGTLSVSAIGGFAVLVVYAAQWVSQRLTERQPAYGNAVPAAVGVLLFAFAARTYARNADWVDQGRFWRSAVEAAPGSYKTNLSAANNTVFLTQQDWDRAQVQMGRALAILDPLPDLENVGIAYQQAGVFYRNLGLRLASSNPRAAAKPAPRIGIASPWTPCCGARRSSSRRTKGIVRKTRGAVSPDSPSCRARSTCKWAALTKSWETGSARSKRSNAGGALESDPDLLEELAAEYRASGDIRKAAMALVEALAVDSRRTRLATQLVELYSQVDPAGCAVSREGGTSGLNVDCPLVHGDICTASRNVARTYLRTWQQAHAEAIRGPPYRNSAARRSCSIESKFCSIT